MPFRWNPREHLALALYVLKWLIVIAPVAIVIGSACALFLWSLNLVTTVRLDHPAILSFLPLAGILIALIYRWFGKSVEAGNNLIMEEIHKPGGGVPRRMAPLVLIGTLITHLFGGSAGREGTAIQMGGSIASGFLQLRIFKNIDRRTLLMAGVAAGFGGVFGTPLAGAIFALEVLAIGRISYEAMMPCLMASVLSDWACTAWGIHHTEYHIASAIGDGVIQQIGYLNWVLFLKVGAAALAFGLVSVLFAELTHGLKYFFERILPWPLLRPALGGIIIIALVYLLGTRDYLGLGVTSPDPNAVTILSSFRPGGAQTWSWFWKLLFTAVTLSCGFKGGEVTPLFFIGAALGNTLAVLLGAPPQLFAALGFVAVFSGATNTPLACTIMGVELFGSGYVLYLALACFLAYLLSGHSGIYLSQRIGTPKTPSPNIPPNSSLDTARKLKPGFGGLWFSKLDRNERSSPDQAAQKPTHAGKKQDGLENGAPGPGKKL